MFHEFPMIFGVFIGFFHGISQISPISPGPSSDRQSDLQGTIKAKPVRPKLSSSSCTDFRWTMEQKKRCFGNRNYLYRIYPYFNSCVFIYIYLYLYLLWVVVSPPVKNISRIGSSSQLLGKI